MQPQQSAVQSDIDGRPLYSESLQGAKPATEAGNRITFWRVVLVLPKDASCQLSKGVPQSDLFFWTSNGQNPHKMGIKLLMALLKIPISLHLKDLMVIFKWSSQPHQHSVHIKIAAAHGGLTSPFIWVCPEMVSINLKSLGFRVWCCWEKLDSKAVFGWFPFFGTSDKAISHPSNIKWSLGPPRVSVETSLVIKITTDGDVPKIDC